MAGPSVRLVVRVTLAVLLALTSTLPLRALAADCPGHEALEARLSDPSRARRLPDPLQALISRDRTAPPFAAQPLAATVSPVPPDQFWWNGFGLPVLNAVVHATIVHEGALIVAGEFTFAAGERLNRIARWDGTGWTSLGGGLNGTVYSLAVYEGRLIAGGEFFQSGTIPTGCIAEWDGTRWSALGEPAMGCVHAFASYNGSLVAGGCFTMLTRGVTSVGAWDGLEWHPVGEGSIGGTVFALASYQNEIVAGGNFVTPTMASAIARFDGVAWQPLGSSVSADYSTSVDALIVYGGELIAGGWFNRAGDVPVLSIARWNGVRWDALGGSPGGVYEAFLVDGEELVAAGSLHDGRNSVSLARWNGTSWSAPAEPLHGVRSLTTYQGSLVVGGYFQEAWPEDEPSRPLPWLGRLDGTRWMSFEPWSSGARGLFVAGGAQAFLPYQGRLVVAGSFQYAGSDGGWLPYHGIAQWDGLAWSPIADLSGYVHSLEAFEGDLIVGGNFIMAGTGAYGAARWNGTSWSTMGLAGPLRSLAVYHGELYGAGYFWNDPGSPGEEGVARWDGSQWRMVGGGFPFVAFHTWVSALIVHDDRLIAAGRFDQAGSVDAKNIAAWDGDSWQPIGAGREDELWSLAVFDGELHAGGVGSGRGWPSALGRWDGTAWQDIDIQGCTWVTALHATDRQLFVGGRIDRVNGIPTRNVAVWNRRDWSSLGSGVDAPPYAFGEFAGSLYLGGQFTEAGGKSSFGVARWDRLETSPGSLAKPTLKASPNPFSTETEMFYTLSKPGRVVVEIFDVRGRKVDTVLDAFEGAGPASVIWRPSSRVRVTPGLYFARISANGQESSARVVYTP